MGGIAPLVPTQGLFPSQELFKNHIPIFLLIFQIQIFFIENKF